MHLNNYNLLENRERILKNERDVKIRTKKSDGSAVHVDLISRGPGVTVKRSNR